VIGAPLVSELNVIRPLLTVHATSGRGCSPGSGTGRGHVDCDRKALDAVGDSRPDLNVDRAAGEDWGVADDRRKHDGGLDAVRLVVAVIIHDAWSARTKPAAVHIVLASWPGHRRCRPGAAPHGVRCRKAGEDERGSPLTCGVAMDVPW
jgi:hypothetical protein